MADTAVWHCSAMSGAAGMNINAGREVVHLQDAEPSGKLRLDVCSLHSDSEPPMQAQYPPDCDMPFDRLAGVHPEGWPDTADAQSGAASQPCCVRHWPALP